MTDTSLAPPPARAIGLSTTAIRVRPGDIILIEPRDGCEVYAQVVWNAPAGTRQVIDWIGAVPSRDPSRPSIGTHACSRTAQVTVLGRIGETA